MQGGDEQTPQSCPSKRAETWTGGRTSPVSKFGEKSKQVTMDYEIDRQDSESNHFLTEIEGIHSEVERMNKRSPGLRAIRNVLEHRYCHYAIIVLVIFDVFLVVSSLLVEIRAVESKLEKFIQFIKILFFLYHSEMSGTFETKPRE